MANGNGIVVGAGGREPEERGAECHHLRRARVGRVDEERYQPVTDQGDHEPDAAHVAGDDRDDSVAEALRPGVVAGADRLADERRAG